MLRVYFGDRKNSIYNTSVYFNHSYQEDWITDDFGRAVISDVDHSEVLSGHNIQSPVLGGISPRELSGGVKTLLLMKHFPGKIFNASNCGDVYDMEEFLNAGAKYLREASQWSE